MLSEIVERYLEYKMQQSWSHHMYKLFFLLSFILLLLGNFLHAVHLKSNIFLVVSAAVSCLIMSLELYLINYYLKRRARYKLTLLDILKLISSLQNRVTNLTTKKGRNNYKLLIYTTIIGGCFVSVLKRCLRK